MFQYPVISLFQNWFVEEFVNKRKTPLKVKITDGGYHDFDSENLSFKIATNLM